MSADWAGPSWSECEDSDEVSKGVVCGVCLSGPFNLGVSQP